VSETVELTLSDDVIERIARRAADLVLEELGKGDGPSPYLSVQEAADLLRARRGRVYDLLSDGRLRRYKDGSRVLVRRDELHAYLDAS
jgi:excisionase family DNA binding protein